jgi:AcrR family transcriptional regulator
VARKPGLNLESVVDSALVIADRDGLDKLTLGQVARDLGVKPPSLYEHVEGLEGLRQAIRLRGFGAMDDFLTRATVGKSGDDAILALATEMRVFVQKHPSLYESTVVTIAGDTKEIRQAGEKVLDTLNAVLAGYGITGREAVHAARYLRSLLHGFVSLEKSHGFGLPVDLDESFNRVVALLVQDLRSWKNAKKQK